MNLRKLIDFFPYVYKERDTYKVNGQGILERFLEICGTYLEEYITPDIDKELELIDLDKVPTMYLNYLWEYLGSIPFAYGVSIDKDKFDKYYNGLKSKEELEALSKVWTIQKKGPVVLNDTKVRNLLRYAITLTKIRGTKKFFEVIFRMYGFECLVSDPVLGATYPTNSWVDDTPKFDSEYYKYDIAKFDEDPRCDQCITVNFDISCVFGFMDINSEYFYDSKAILYCGKYDGLLDLYSKVEEYNKLTGGIIVMTESQDEFIQQNESAIFTGVIPASLSDFIAFRRMMVAFFDRYLPYNVKANLTFQRYIIDDKVSIKVTSSDCYDSKYPNTIFRGKKDYVKYHVEVSSLWSGSDLRYKISVDGVNWGEPHENSTDITISIPGTYYIRPCADNYLGDLVILNVDSVMLNTWYTFSYSTPDGTEFGPRLDSLRIYIRGIKHQEKLVDGNIVTTVSGAPIIKILGNTTTLPRLVWDEDPPYMLWTFKTSDAEDGFGSQKIVFAIEESVNKQISFQLTRQPEYAYGSISPTSIYYNDVDTKVVTCYPQTNYGDEGLIGYIGMKCRENGITYSWGDQWNINRDGVTHFEIVRILNGDKKHDARVNAIIIEDTPDHPTKCTFSVIRTPPLVVYIYNPEYFVIEQGMDKATVWCIVDWDGTPPIGTEFNYNVRVLEDGVDTGVVVNAAPPEGGSLPELYEVDHACTITFVSLQDTTVQGITQVVDERVTNVENRLVISPVIDGEGNWDTNMWSTDWSDSNEKSMAIAKGGYAKFYVRLYTEKGMIVGEQILIQDANWQIKQTAYTGDLVEITGVGQYYIVHSVTNLQATLLIST